MGWLNEAGFPPDVSPHANARAAFVVSSHSRYDGRMRRSRPASASFHRAPFRWALCMGLVMFVAGCQSDAPKHSEDHMHLERIIKAVEALRAAYEHQDLKALQALHSPSTNLDQLERDAEKDFSAYDTIALTLTIERIYIQEEQATVNVRWEGAWQHGSDETLMTDQGYGVLVWSGLQTVLLEQMTGNLPFGIANR